MVDLAPPGLTPRIWQVSSLCRAIADSFEARFNPVAVRGELTGFSRASSGHCYFSLKDAQGQLRCAMFRRAASFMQFVPRDGELVQVFGRLGVYEPRGELQLIVETLSRAGQGALFEQFLQSKARLEAEGLFDPARKRGAPGLPRGIGIATSPGAAALHDVVATLRRRVPHVPVIVAPAAVQGPQAPAELVRALLALYRLALSGALDVILLVRGGGSIEDLWAFNDEQLARTIVQSPVPLISGIGHETDFTIADFCADLRAATPTAAAEMAANTQESGLENLNSVDRRFRATVTRRFDLAVQRLDGAAARLGRPSARISPQQLRLGRAVQRLRYAVLGRLEREASRSEARLSGLQRAVRGRLGHEVRQLDQFRLRLELLDPKLVLQRGYALLADAHGRPVASVRQTHPGQALVATLADGEVDLKVAPPVRISS